MESTKVSKISQAYGKTINFVNYFGFVPYKWCELHQKVTYEPFKVKWVVFLGVAAALHEIFFVTQSIRLFQNRQSIPLITLTRTFSITFSYIVSNQNFDAIFRYPSFHAAFANSMIRTAKSFYDGPFEVRRGNERSLLAIIWILRHVAFKILPASFVLPILWKPEVPLFYTSILKDPQDCCRVARFAIFLIQAYISAIFLGMLVYNGVVIAVCLFFITDMLRIAGSNIRGTSGKIMRLKLKRIKLNAELSILVNCFNQIFREWTSWVQLFLAVYVIVNVTAAVLTGELRVFLTSIMAFTVLFYLIALSGNVFVLSQQLLGKERSNGETRRSWIEKYRRAFRPLRIEFGQYFYADQYLKLTVLSAVLTNSANLLVTLRNA